MSASAEFRAYLQEHLSALGPLRFRAMFGGHSIYLHDTIFAIVVQDVLYLKTRPETAPRFAAAGSEPFTYQTKDGKTVAMAYWRLPDSALDDPEEAVAWARQALGSR